MKMKKQCPFCGNYDVEFYEGSDFQATAIYCCYCPCGLEDNRKTLDQLINIWENRNENNKR